jgi:hypothetical protein
VTAAALMVHMGLKTILKGAENSIYCPRKWRCAVKNAETSFI